MNEEQNWSLVSSARHPDEDSVVATVLMYDGLHVFVGQQLEDGTRTWTPDAAAGQAMEAAFETDADAATEDQLRLAQAADDCMAGLTQVPWSDLTGDELEMRSAAINLVSDGGGQLRVVVSGAAEALEYDIGDSARKSIGLKVPDASLMFVALAAEVFSGLTMRGLGGWLAEKEIPHAWETDYYE